MNRANLYIFILAMIAAAGCGSSSEPPSEPMSEPMSESPAAVPVSPDPIEVDGGLIVGVQLPDSAVTVYKGIPYAAPPVGDLRWQAPQAALPWEGVLAADTDADACVQELQRSRLPWSEEFMHLGDASEDCLYLNLWTAAQSADERRPVMVWLHGGGLREGSNAIATYDGTTFAGKGVVLVGVNYRLGGIGFFAHPELTAESGHSASGNYGFLDQVAALNWIQKNIASFGGDPNNVTIFGQSAGARSVAMLMQSPLAKGLFRQAIIESGAQRRGGVANPDMMSLAEAEQLGIEAQETLGVASLAELRAIPATRFLEADIGRRNAIADGWFWPANLETEQVPVIVGFTADDGFVGPDDDELTVDSYAVEAQELYGEHADAYLSLYPVDAESDIRTVKLAALRDKARTSVSLWADFQLEHSDQVYTYFFDRATPWPEHPEFGAHHTGEIPYVFGTLGELIDRRPDEVDYRISEMVSSYWANFATAGDPNGDGLPEWPAFDAAAGSIMRLAGDTGPIPLADPAKVAFWSKVLTPTT